MTGSRGLEFAEKFLEAKRLEAEAFMAFLPESSREHLSVIKEESAALLKEAILGAVKTEKNDMGRTKKGNVKKVEIE